MTDQIEETVEAPEDTDVSQEAEEQTEDAKETEVEEVEGSKEIEEAETEVEIETEESPDVAAALAAQASQIAALRTMVGKLRTEAAVAGAQATQAAAGVHAMDDEQLDAVGTPNVLKLQQQFNSIVEDPTIVGNLQATFATMQANPAMYPNIEQFCTAGTMEDVLEQIATNLVGQGTPPAEAGLQAQISLWGMKNPYEYVYTATQAAQAPVAAQPKKQQPKVIPSPAAISGGGKGNSGWTAKKLDNMSEHQLDSVPPDVYQKWLMGNLK